MRHTAVRDWALPLLALYTLSAWARPPLQQPLHGQSKPGSHGAVASESAICSEIGINLMRQGGTAADALVGTTLCVGVIGMYHSGIGGGGFMLVRSRDGAYESVDYREAAPAAAYEDMYEGNIEGSVIGGLAVAVPGELRGLEYLHKNYGVLPWKAVVMPAVHVAREGFPVTEDLVRYMEAATSHTSGNFLVEDPVWAEDFAPNGALLALGDTITRKRYADTLEAIGHHGVDIFYSGAIGQSIVEAVQAKNGTLTLADLSGYEVKLRPVVRSTYRGRRLVSTGVPSSGAVALSVLATMDQYPAEVDDANLTTHRFDEALRFGYGARTHLGDPDHLESVGAIEAELLSAERARATRRKIRDDATLPVAAYNPQGTFAKPGHGTSHVVAADGSGLAVSSTTTINTLFGSRVMTPDGGVILNNEMNDFSIPGADNEFGYPPSPANFVRGGKRPLSSITPIMAEAQTSAGGPWRLALVVGAAGGSRIISATAQVAWHVLEHGLSMAEALAAPRLHDQLAPNVVAFETEFDRGTVASMAAKGHNVSWVAWGGSSAQGIRIDDGLFEAAGEPRQTNSGGFSF